jgi:uncharacterized membrane protein YkvA (DUF1232 family)
VNIAWDSKGVKWLLIILALVYFISPYDLIPGFSAVSWLDDIVILILLFRYLAKIKSDPRKASDSFKTHRDRQHARQSHDTDASESQKPPQTPYEVLNLPPDADQEAIKAAYRRLAKQYHPDRVSHLGKEFQELAERRFKEIQEAYEKLAR